MAYRWPLATCFVALVLGAAPRAQSQTAGRPMNPLRDPAPASTLEHSEFALPPPVENSPALRYVSAVEEELASPEAELLPKPNGPKWGADPPGFAGRGMAAPLAESEQPPLDLPPGMLPRSAEPAPNAFSEAYPPAFKAPLVRESWLFRPYHVDGFLGTLLVDNPLSNRVDAGSAFYIGFRLGWDFSNHFGLESNFGFAKTGNRYPQLPLKMGDEKLFLWDIDWLWYPWGDTRLRPYLLIGSGLNDVSLVNDLDQRLHATLFNLPWGGGFRYRLGNRLAFRFDVRDNVSYGASNGMNLMHNVALTCNLEWHFGGGSRRSYWPWNPSRTWW